MKNKLKTIYCLMLAVLCMASFSITAFASGGDETATVPDAETATDPKEDIEIPYSYIIDEDGNLVITIGGVTDPAELATIGTVVTGGSRLNVRTGAGMSYEIIDQLADAGSAVIVISSELPELLGICDRIYTMCNGTITANVDAKSTNQEELMRYMTAEVPIDPSKVYA